MINWGTGGVQNNTLRGGSVEEGEAHDVSEWVLLDVMQQALNQVN